MESKKPFLFALIFLIVISVPYIIASALVDDAHVFGGFLLNPVDGNSYLAKMDLGYSGNWLFSLSYTFETGEAVFLFIFYIFLGHIARWIGAPLILIFHIFRIFGAGLLYYSLFQLVFFSMGIIL